MQLIPAIFFASGKFCCCIKYGKSNCHYSLLQHMNCKLLDERWKRKRSPVNRCLSASWKNVRYKSINRRDFWMQLTFVFTSVQFILWILGCGSQTHWTWYARTHICRLRANATVSRWSHSSRRSGCAVCKPDNILPVSSEVRGCTQSTPSDAYGQSERLEKCPAPERRMLRLVSVQLPRPKVFQAVLFTNCLVYLRLILFTFKLLYRKVPLNTKKWHSMPTPQKEICLVIYV